jgi:hypothetical protein
MPDFKSAAIGHLPSRRVLRRPHFRRAATAFAAMLIAPLTATSLWASAGKAPSAPHRLSQSLSVALAGGHLQVEDLHGREVFANDETRLGTFKAVAAAMDRLEPVMALVALEPRLGLGGGCIAVPLTWMLEASEQRLVLLATWDELRAASATHPACDA